MLFRSGVVESVKAASDIYAPVAGEVVAANAELGDAPEKVNQDAYGAWMYRLRPDSVAAVDALLKSQRPVIVAGLGVGDSVARSEVFELAEMLSATVVTSYARNDMTGMEHAQALGAIGRGGSPEAKAAAQSADLILAAGTRLAHFTTMYNHSMIPAGVPILQIEIDPKEVGRNYPLAVGRSEEHTSELQSH